MDQICIEKNNNDNNNNGSGLDLDDSGDLIIFIVVMIISAIIIVVGLIVGIYCILKITKKPQKMDGKNTNEIQEKQPIVSHNVQVEGQVNQQQHIQVTNMWCVSFEGNLI